MLESSELPSASDMRKISDEIRSVEEIRTLSKQIRDSAAEGEIYCEAPSTISAKTKSQLTQLGYNIKLGADGKYTVSW